MAAIDAQKWLNDTLINNSITDKNTVCAINSLNTGGISLTGALPFTPGGVRLELKGELTVEGFHSLDALNLEDASRLDKLVVKDCPNLKKINIQNSGVKELELGAGLDNLLYLDFSFDVNDPILRPAARELEELDLRNVPNLKVIRCFGVHKNTKIKGFETLKHIQCFNSGGSINDTSVILIPTQIFQEWKEGVKEALGITDVDLPNDWHTNLTNKLGGANLDQMPSGKTLKDLIDAFSTDKDDLQKKLDQAQEELDKRKDYEEIKQERDQLKQQLAAIREKLGLGDNANQEQVLNKIEELKNAPPACSHTNYDAIKAERDKLKIENKRLKDEKKENIKVVENKTNNLFKELNVSSNEIKDTVSLVRLEEARNEVIIQEFGKLKDENNGSFNLNIGLGVLTVGSWLISGLIVMKQVNLPKVEPKKEKSG